MCLKNIWFLKKCFFVDQIDDLLSSNKQDSKELSPRPLENAPNTFNSKKAL